MDYQFSSGADQKFSINNATGRIKTTAGLDREAKGSYTLGINVTDKGTPSLWVRFYANKLGKLLRVAFFCLEVHQRTFFLAF